MQNDPIDLFGDSDTSFEKGTAPESVEHVSFEMRMKFFPWHKPRKQFLRVEQWGESISKLVDTLSLKKISKPLSYLSLPGPDLLDVRSLQPVCAKKNVQLLFLGLNGGEDDDKESAHLNAALLNEVRSLPCVDAASGVVPDIFQHLAKKKSIAYERIIEAHRSFDVINIDLCNSMAESEPGIKGANLVNALFNLVKHQAKSRTQDWILFLTTRSNRDAVNEGTMDTLLNWINQLIGADTKILDDFLKQGLVLPTELTDGKIDLKKISSATHSNTFAMGIGHWILNSMFDNNPAWRVDMLPQFGYHVSLTEASCDMLSLGFYCKRIITPMKEDALGLARLEQAAPVEDMAVTLKKCRQKIHQRVQKSDDIDIKLHQDEALYNRYLEETTKLLVASRYDEVEYRKFAESERVKLAGFLKSNNLI